MDTILSDLAKFAQPINTLVEKMASGAGVLYAPFHTRQMAQANADAAIIEAKAELEIADLRQRAGTRIMIEAMRNQLNIERIADKALPQLEMWADATKIDDDWMANFFDKCRLVSDEQMQRLWSKLLAGEVNAPGAYSKRAVNLLADMSSTDAELFTALCSFGFGEDHRHPLIFDATDPIYTDLGIDSAGLLHLQSIGLIFFDEGKQFNVAPDGCGFQPDHVALEYFEKLLTTIHPNIPLDIGNVMLTAVGRELAPISGASEIPGFFQFVLDRLNGLVVEVECMCH